MPNAGIHATRSTNWNSADAELNPAHSASVTPKVASENASASQRIRPLRRPSALPTNSNTMAPTSGNAQESVSIFSLSPEVVTQDHDHADEQRSCVGAHRARLQTPQHAGAAVHDRRRPIHRAVDHAHIEPAPQAFGGCGFDWLDD